MNKRQEIRRQNVQEYIIKVLDFTKSYLSKNFFGFLEDIDHEHTEMLFIDLLNANDRIFRLYDNKLAERFSDESESFWGSYTLSGTKTSRNDFVRMEKELKYFFTEKNFKVKKYEVLETVQKYTFQKKIFDQKAYSLLILAEHKKMYIKKLISFAQWNEVFVASYQDDFAFAEDRAPIVQIYIELYCKEEFFTNPYRKP